MGFFKKKKKDEELAPIEATSGDASYQDPEVPVAAASEEPRSSSSDATLGKLTADVEKLKAQFSTFYELQKASNERFANITEQLGGIRSMMMERDKSAQILEAKTAQAVDLVKTVQPDKFMVDLRKMDSKIEAVRANMEGNETILKNAIGEMKDMRNKMSVFKGMEQVIKMNDDVKNELIEIKKLQAIVERHADKVETIFSEMQKKFSDFIKTADMVKDLDKSFKSISSDFDSIKIKINDFSSKKEVENLIVKFDDFEKYVGNVVNLLNRKSMKMEAELLEEFKKKFSETDQLLQGFKILASRTPDLDKYFNLLDEEAKKAAVQKQVDPEKIKELGAEDKLEVKKEDTKLDKMKGAASGVAGRVAGLVKK